MRLAFPVPTCSPVRPQCGTRVPPRGPMCVASRASSGFCDCAGTAFRGFRTSGKMRRVGSAARALLTSCPRSALCMLLSWETNAALVLNVLNLCPELGP